MVWYGSSCQNNDLQGKVFEIWRRALSPSISSWMPECVDFQAGQRQVQQMEFSPGYWDLFIHNQTWIHFDKTKGRIITDENSLRGRIIAHLSSCRPNNTAWDVSNCFPVPIISLPRACDWCRLSAVYYVRCLLSRTTNLDPLYFWPYAAYLLQRPTYEGLIWFKRIQLEFWRI